MRRLIFSAGMLFGATAFGQNLLVGIDPDVVKGLLSIGSPDAPVVSAAIPQELSGITMPGTFRWIGSLERKMDLVTGQQGFVQVTAAYRTTLAPEVARTQALGAMKAAGWEAQPEMFGMTMDVFTSRDQQSAQMLCRNKLPISLSANSLDNITYVVLSASRNANNTACDSSRPGRFPPPSGFEGQLPKLDLPINPATGLQPRLNGGGSGGHGSGRDYRTEFASSDSASNVGTHFARQMQSQGWSMDASWNGDSTAGSSWSKHPDANTTLLSTLQVTSVGDARMRAALHIVKLK